ncbi:hypothetical protein [Emticicia sp. 17c]|uniref:hypothetical protein n=1 Tax=Emticicia sp. 17c TaxID=3127704 RepID=UPI00301D9688
MKSIKLIVIYLTVSIYSHGQQIKLNYILNENIGLKTDSLFLGMDQEFSSIRYYYSSNTFSETRIFSGDTRKAILFKIENHTWYYKSSLRWKLFYDYDRKAGGSINLSKVKYKIIFKNEVSVNGTILQKIVLEPLKIRQSHQIFYYFNAKEGVTIIKTANAVLLRDDIFNTQLNQKKIDAL